MLWSAVVLGVSMLIFTVMIALPNPTLATQWTAIAFIIIYNLAFGYGWVGCPWLYGPEVSYVSVKIDIFRITNMYERLRRFDIAISLELLGLWENGYSHSSPCSQAGLEPKLLDGRSGSGRSCSASSRCCSFISAARRYATPPPFFFNSTCKR